MAVSPTTRSSFTSTVWNASRKAGRSTNAAKFGGPNVNISQGSKVQFGDGSVVWDVVRVFEDGTLFLSATTSGRKITRRVPPSSKSWTNLWIVDGKRVQLDQDDNRQQVPRGGGPNRTIQAGNIVILGSNSSVRWTVQSVLRDGTVNLYTSSGEKVIHSTVGPQSRYWRTMYSVNG